MFENVLQIPNLIKYKQFSMQVAKSPQVDLTFLSLVPNLDILSLHLFPIDHKLLNGLLRQAIQNYKADAALGATLILLAKNNYPSTKAQFPIIYDKQLDQLMFLISQAGPNFKLQTLSCLTRLNGQKLVSEFNMDKKKKYFFILRQFQNMFMQTLASPIQKQGQRLDMILNIQKLIVQQKDQQMIKYYKEVSENNGTFIYKNKKELPLLKMILQLQYVIVKEMNKRDLQTQQIEIYKFVELKKNGIYRVNRPSISIEITSFLLFKLLLIRRELSKEDYEQMMLSIEEIIDKNQITRLNLEQRTDLFAFHMKNNHYFYYLEQLFDPNAKSQYQLISLWKHKISKAINGYISADSQKIGQHQYLQTIFYLQIRNRAEFLWNTSAAVNHFPQIQSKALRRFMKNDMFKGSAEGFTQKFLMKLARTSLQQMHQIYGQFNIFEKAIFFYYMNNFEENFSLPKRLLREDKETIIPKFQRLVQKFTNAQLLQLLDFYISEIELGNYYRLQKPQQCIENCVNQGLYRRLVKNVYLRLMSFLQQYKKFTSTQDLTYFSQFHKYLRIMIRASCPKFPIPFMCKRCKCSSERPFCEICEGICIGIQLFYANPSIKNIGINDWGYQKKLNAVTEKMIQIDEEVLAKMNDCANPWPYMVHFALNLD